MTPEKALSKVSRLLLDTGPVINILDHIEFNDRWRKTWALLDHAMEKGVQLVVSPLTLMEVLAKKAASEEELKKYAEFCLGTREIEFRPLLVDEAFSIRVGHYWRTTGCKVPDCIQFVAAELLACDAILTNDAEWEGAYSNPFIVVERLDI